VAGIIVAEQVDILVVWHFHPADYAVLAKIWVSGVHCQGVSCRFPCSVPDAG
jgi:hypothetical protein